MLRFLVALCCAVLAVQSAQSGSLALLGAGKPAAAPVGYTGPGDIIASWNFWYGLRGFSAADTNPAANVCLPSDTTCADLTLSSGDVVVPGSLSTCNITTVICTVKTLYDKSGGARNITNATEANRPTFRPAMAANGCPATTKPCMKFVTASSQNLTSAGGITYTQPFTFSFVYNSTTTGNTEPAANGGSVVALTQNNALICNTGSSITGTATNSAFHAVQCVFNGTSSVIAIDGTEVTGDAGTGAPTTAAISMGKPSVSAFFEGFVNEYGSAIGAASGGVRTILNSNQHTYWAF